MTNTDIQEYSGIPDLNMVCVHKKKKKLGGKIMPGMMLIWPVCHFLSQWNHKNSYAWVTSSKKASKKHHYRLDSEHVWNLLPIGNFPINRYHSPLTYKEAWKVWGDECYRKIVQLKQDETGKPREETTSKLLCCATGCFPDSRVLPNTYARGCSLLEFPLSEHSEDSKNLKYMQKP